MGLRETKQDYIITGIKLVMSVYEDARIKIETKEFHSRNQMMMFYLLHGAGHYLKSL
jgi:hypothetical protein